MSKNLHAVIMGFNRVGGYDDELYFPPLQFAEKDAYDLYHILTDKDSCNIPREYVSLIVGKVPSHEDIQDEIYSKINPKRNTVDTILFYYSGYAFSIGDKPEVFLALPNMSMLKIFENPMVALKSALPISFLGNNFFRGQSSNGAKNKILLLDCYDCGRFHSKAKDNDKTRLSYLTEEHEFNSEDTVVLVSMHKMITTKEGEELRNGIFTFDLITGLLGTAIGDRGEVTVNSLIAYLQDTMPSPIQPTRYGTRFPRITLNSTKDIPVSILTQRTQKQKEYYEAIQQLYIQSSIKLKVFLSYSSTDKDRVRDIYQKLSLEKEVVPWFNEKSLLPGEDWELEIKKAIKSSDAVIVFLSKRSINKEGHVQKEIKQALDLADEKPEGTIFIIPARLEDCDVPPGLQRWQWLNVYEPDFYDKLITALKRRSHDLAVKNAGVQ